MHRKNRIVGLILGKTVFLIFVSYFSKLVEFLFFEKVVLITFPKTSVEIFYLWNGPAQKLVHLIRCYLASVPFSFSILVLSLWQHF